MDELLKERKTYKRYLSVLDRDKRDHDLCHAQMDYFYGNDFEGFVRETSKEIGYGLVCSLTLNCVSDYKYIQHILHHPQVDFSQTTSSGMDCLDLAFIFKNGNVEHILAAGFIPTEHHLTIAIQLNLWDIVKRILDIGNFDVSRHVLASVEFAEIVCAYNTCRDQAIIFKSIRTRLLCRDLTDLVGQHVWSMRIFV